MPMPKPVFSPGEASLKSGPFSRDRPHHAPSIPIPSAVDLRFRLPFPSIFKADPLQPHRGQCLDRGRVAKEKMVAGT